MKRAFKLTIPVLISVMFFSAFVYFQSIAAPDQSTGRKMDILFLHDTHSHLDSFLTMENGEVAIVMVGDDEATMKRFYQDGDTVTLMPQSTNPAHMPQIYNLKETPIRVIGKVVKAEFQVL